jgi:hypothetical protein
MIYCNSRPGDARRVNERDDQDDLAICRRARKPWPLAAHIALLTVMSPGMFAVMF